MTLSTSALNGSIPVLGARWPITWARCTPVVAFDVHRPPAWAGWAAGMNAATGLHARLLVSAEPVVVLTQRLTVLNPLVKIEHPGCFDGKVPVTRGDPGPMLPRLERVSGQPAAHRGG